MTRLSHLFLLVLVLSSSLLFAASAVDDSDSPVPKESSPPPRRVKISQQDYPYGKPKEATGVKFSEYQSLAVPPYILIAVLVLFLAAAAYVIFKIFDTQQEKGQQPHTHTHSPEESSGAGGGEGERGRGGEGSRVSSHYGRLQ